jgi:hypothetical protein
MLQCACLFRRRKRSWRQRRTKDWQVPFKVVNVYCRVYLLLDIYLTLLPLVVFAQKRMLLRRRIGGAESLCFGQFIYRNSTSVSVKVDTHLVSRGTRQSILS